MDLVTDKIYDLVTNILANDHLVWVERGKLEHKTAKSTAYVQDGRDFCQLLYTVIYRPFFSVGVDQVVVSLVEERWTVQTPVHMARIQRHVHDKAHLWVHMSMQSVKVLFRHFNKWFEYLCSTLSHFYLAKHASCHLK